MKPAGEKAKEIFLKAVEQYPEDQWEAYLDGACGDDPEIRSRVEGLLKAHAQLGSFQDDVASSEADPTAYYAPLKEGPGTVIGPYKLLQKIGEGGFGVVYMAEQERPVRRKVALKVIKPGMDTQEVVSRFEAEEQALALMDHPNIARVFDAGATKSGRPYFVMELVKGIPITEYCDKSDLTPNERLGLFISVCNAVQHAHQKGVIHRDIKPNNVLVTLHDGEPVVKVIDFGVAKATNARLTERTLFTRFEQMIGTPMYMSPEQAEMSGLDVDTRTDIYSLGVLLYELLTGSTPFDRGRLLEAGLDEIRRIIREEEPIKPSTKISTLDEVLTDVSKHRKTEPKRLSAVLRGDLDWIVMKALEKDRRRRYETAKDFAEDIGRYLNSEPVEASPPSLIYRAQKFVRRNRAFVAGTTVAALMLVLLTAGGLKTYVSGLEADIANSKLDIAEKERIINENIARETERELAAEEQRRIQAEKQQEKLERRKTDLPKLRQLITEEQWANAFELVDRLKADFPEDKEVQQLWHQTTCTWSVVTDPPGAKVSRKPYAEGKWQPFGVTPVDIAIARGVSRWKIEKEGYEVIEGVAGPEDVQIERMLDEEGSIPAGMVRVATSNTTGQMVSFVIDRFEVTNRQFQENFVAKGGYENPLYWDEPFIQDGHELTFDEAMKVFCDSTGKAGPATWTNGSYPADEAEYPVRGISWYEAAAYAKAVKKSLPTIAEWQAAASLDQVATIIPHSNFSDKGPVAVGTCQGISFFGTFDMAGNVKEWCCNPVSGGQRPITGGAWSDFSYMFSEKETYPPIKRLPTFGLRCVAHSETAPARDRSIVIATGVSPPEFPLPLTAQEVASLKTVFKYDQQAPLAPKPVPADEEPSWYRHETVSVNAAYGGEKLILHLFLPKTSDSLVQPIIYFPGIGGIPLKHFQDGATLIDRQLPLALVAKNRAVCWPVYKGTFERNDGFRIDLASSQKREYQIQMVKDLRRAIDYLETRPEFKMDCLAYVGFSWGAFLGPMMSVVEPRIKSSVYVAGGLQQSSHPEVDSRNYIPHVSTPVLMLGGDNDAEWRVVGRQAVYDHLAVTNKEYVHYDSGHILPMDQSMNCVSDWLDKIHGPVEVKPISPEDRIDRLVEMAQRQTAGGQHAEAKRCYEDVLPMLEKELGSTHSTTLSTKLALADTLKKLKQFEKALPLFEEVLEARRRELGHEDAVTLQTAETLATSCNMRAWELCSPVDATPENCDRAAVLIQRATEADPLKGWRLALALAQYRQRNWQACLETMQESLEIDNPWSSQWFLLAMVHQQSGDTEVARDWYTAACEWVTKSNTKHEPTLQIQSEAASVLGLPTQWPPAEWTREQRLEAYNRLISVWPDLAPLYHCRGSHYGRLGEWTKAMGDYRKAADLDPDFHRYREAEAAVVAYVGTPEEQQSVCDRFLEECRNNAPSARADMVLLRSLVPGSSVDRNELDRIIDEVLADAKAHHIHLLIAKGMALYRLGRFEEALAILPESSLGFNNPKDAILPVFVRAMAHHQLGDAYTCRKLLTQARQASKEQIESPEGPILPYQDRPVVWCMIQIALREAEALIGPADDSPQDVTDVAVKK